MLPMLASTERELAICEGDVKMFTWLAFDRVLPLRLDRTTPGIARKPTLAVSITVDWKVKVMWTEERPHKKTYPEDYIFPFSYEFSHEALPNCFNNDFVCP